MSESTHKHRNVIDDILDLGLSAACVVYYLFHEQIGLSLTDEQMVTIGAAGAAGRASLRRIMMKLWGAKLDAESSSETADADAAGGDGEADKETVSAPVSDGEDSDEKETPPSSDETQEATKVDPPPKVAPPPKVG